METKTRIAIVYTDKCQPKKCGQECKKACPVVMMGKLCIEVDRSFKTAIINEGLCIGCGICTKKCPFDAIKIINLPHMMNSRLIHKYGFNGFRLHNLPFPKGGKIVGIVGQNGIGKSTVVKILGEKIIPNLAINNTEWSSVLDLYKGTEMYSYILKIVTGELRHSIKPQYVDAISKIDFKGKTVDEILGEEDHPARKSLQIEKFGHRIPNVLSGGELQRFAIVRTIMKKNTNLYIFDEPSSFLDVKQRLNMVKVLPKRDDCYTIVIEHDLSITDYMCDSIHLMYGEPGCYGSVTLPLGVREGINMYLDGYISTENMRFRNYSINFHNKVEEKLDEKLNSFSYENKVKVLGDFTLNIMPGEYSESEIILLIGENGLGKTTFLRDLFEEKSDIVSYKPQRIIPKFNGTVSEILYSKAPRAVTDCLFIDDVVKPLQIGNLMNKKVKDLSGGELQRVSIVLCLGKPALIYLLDEPSAYLDVEQRLIVSKIVKRFITSNKRIAFIVEHDLLMVMHLADKIIRLSGEPSTFGIANPPCSMEEGLNDFLKSLDVTVRRDPETNRPRINREDSQKDSAQKKAGTYI